MLTESDIMLTAQAGVEAGMTSRFYFDQAIYHEEVV